MFNNKTLLEVDKENVKIMDIMFNKIKSTDIMSYKDALNLKVDLKKRRVFFILEGEEVYIKLLTLPKVRGRKLEKIIRNELIYEFHSIDNILYNYKIHKENKDNIEILVFCVNIDKNIVLKEYLKSNKKIKGIYLIQFCVLEKYKEVIKEENFILIMKYKKYIYSIFYKNNEILNNEVIKENEDLNSKLNKFLFECCGEKHKCYKKIYTLNIKNLENLKEELKDFEFIDLGYFNEKLYNTCFKR
ncbi:hypothetical protein [Clostridium niameyense]|uniref:hypothetical protein n=1 Tax=Clostridium niameyense TaxID=1622073 RepID=UPI00067F65E9|nr:hypothetical protein [Clostridium niameyense]